ncbi:MAG: Fe(3+)-hydroxamate ABC transporter permease FhuB [Castellaniella sp.]|uniref:Fe(3+)-hydroxamate ABC transporter permease FhuB n=1 Tax=Castellaniella sp. TaxID=1955812 RepID=UPI003C774B68
MTAMPRTAVLICTSLALLLVTLAAASLQPLGGASAALDALRATTLEHASVAELLLSQSWWPRLVLALLAGSGLALAGELLQLLLRNPLASATTLGISSGASVALMLTTLFAPSLLAQGQEWVAMLGAGLTLALVFQLSWRHGLDPLVLIVVGMTLNLLLGGLSIVLLIFNHEALSGLLIWGAGSLAQQGWDGVRFLAPRLLACVLCLLPLLRLLRLAPLDDVTLRSLGLPMRHLRVAGLGLAVFLVGSLVSSTGVIGFVGLVAPNIMKLAGASRLASRLPLSMLFGALLLASADLLVQTYASGISAFVPTGAVTAALGVPLLLWLLIRLRLPTAPGAAGDAYMPSRQNAGHTLAWLGLLLPLSLMLALSFGQLLHGWHWQAPFSVDSLQWRLPRVIAAGCGGILLALAGVILQRLTGNPLASPELLGVSSGSAIALSLGVFLLPQPSYLMLSGTALLGAGVALLLILVSNRRNHYSSQGILLTGIALGALYEALRSLLLADGDPRGQQLTAWLSGSTYYASASMSWTLLALTLAAVPLAGATSRWQDLFPLGQPTAHALGVPVRKARFVMLLLAAAFSALATLVIGPLSFVGLIAPHMARMLGFRRAKAQLAAAALLGAIVMILADWLGRQVLFPQEIPAGLMASLAGGSYFLWQIRRWR